MEHGENRLLFVPRHCRWQSKQHVSPASPCLGTPPDQLHSRRMAELTQTLQVRGCSGKSLWDIGKTQIIIHVFMSVHSGKHIVFRPQAKPTENLTGSFCLFSIVKRGVEHHVAYVVHTDSRNTFISKIFTAIAVGANS